jgi:hypothetical protein
LFWLAEEALCAPLPVGWSEHVHPENASFYFHHAATGESTWFH